MHRDSWSQAIASSVCRARVGGEEGWVIGTEGGRERRGRDEDVKRGWELSRLYSQGTQWRKK